VSEGVTVDLEELRKDFESDLLRLAHILCGDFNTAEDLVQEVWAKVAKTSSQPASGSERSWLMQILRHCKIDRMRRELKVRLTNVSDIQSSDSGDTSPLDAIACNDPESPLDRLERSEAIRACLEAIEEEFRVVLILIYYEQQSYEQIAKTIQSKLGTVSSRASRGRALVKDCMKRKGWS
jgi:RNA polymerase sigma factor (sigma-70 family)